MIVTRYKSANRFLLLLSLSANLSSILSSFIRSSSATSPTKQQGPFIPIFFIPPTRELRKAYEIQSGQSGTETAFERALSLESLCIFNFSFKWGVFLSRLKWNNLPRGGTLKQQGPFPPPVLSVTGMNFSAPDPLRGQSASFYCLAASFG